MSVIVEVREVVEPEFRAFKESSEIFLKATFHARPFYFL